MRFYAFERRQQNRGLGPPDFSFFSVSTHAYDRGPLSLLAGMSPGNIAGLIDLEGAAAPDFGGGGGDGLEGNSKSNEGSGSERIARLSESAYNAVMLTPSWRCRTRLAAGSWLMAYWPVRILISSMSPISRAFEDGP